MSFCAITCAITPTPASAVGVRVTFDELPNPVCEIEAAEYLGENGFLAVGTSENSTVCIGHPGLLGLSLEGCSNGNMLFQRVDEGLYCNEVTGCNWLSVPSTMILRFKTPTARVSFCRPGADSSLQLPGWSAAIRRGGVTIDSIAEVAPTFGEAHAPATFELAGTVPFNTLVITTTLIGDTGGMVIDDLQFEPWCAADFNNSGGTPDTEDLDAFFSAWLAGDALADVDASGGTPDTADIGAFFDLWLAGGCEIS